jgi:hypothetical protein
MHILRTFSHSSVCSYLIPSSVNFSPSSLHVTTTRTQVPVEMVVEKIIKVPGEDRVVYKEVFVCVRVCVHTHKSGWVGGWVGALQSSDG